MSKIPDYSGEHNRTVAVYCWSRTEPGSDRWAQAETIGRLAAESGFSVATGGYSGSMEAVSKGAREVVDKAKAGSNDNDVAAASAASCEVIGVVVSEVFPDRVTHGNPFLTDTRDSTGMLERIDQLTRLARYYVILPGTMGTLQELTCIWTLSVLHPKDRPRPVIIAFRDPWERCVAGIMQSLSLPAEQADLITFVDTPEEAMDIINKDDAMRKAAAKK